MKQRVVSSGGGGSCTPTLIQTPNSFAIVHRLVTKALFSDDRVNEGTDAGGAIKSVAAIGVSLPGKPFERACTHPREERLPPMSGCEAYRICCTYFGACICSAADKILRYREILSDYAATSHLRHCHQHAAVKLRGSTSLDTRPPCTVVGGGPKVHMKGMSHRTL